MLGRWQREVLQRYAECLHVGSEPKTIRITVGRYSRFTREAGGGSGHPITVGIFYPSEPEFFRPVWIATCQYRDDAIRKAQEIARHLRDVLGVAEDSISVRG